MLSALTSLSDGFGICALDIVVNWAGLRFSHPVRGVLPSGIVGIQVA